MSHGLLVWEEEEKMRTVEEHVESVKHSYYDEVECLGVATDPNDSTVEYGVWVYNQNIKFSAYGRHMALRLKYRKKTREVVAWHLQLWNPKRVQRDYPEIPEEKLPIVGEVEFSCL